MTRKILLIIPLIIIIGVAAFLYLQLNPLPEPLAKLSIESGTVEYSAGNGFLKASNGMELREGYAVRTGPDSVASIILRASSAIRLAENTEITIDKVQANSPLQFKARQSRGRTWHRILKMTDVGGYEMRTPNMVATVRGTVWDLNMHDSINTCSTISGNVQCGAEESMRTVAPGRRLDADANGAFTEGDLIEDDWIRQNKQRDDSWIEELKAYLRQKYGFLIGTAKSQGLTDAQLEEYLDGYVRGTLSIQDAINKGIIPEKFAGIIPEELKRY